MMDLDEVIDLNAPRDQVVEVLSDLASYAEWLEIVALAERAGPEMDGSPVWTVELRARIGPFARTKRLRMVRTVMDIGPDRTDLVFTRSEEGKRDYSEWTLSVAVTDSSEGASRVVIHLHYGGSLWTPGPLERVLADQVRVGRERLSRVVGTNTR
ncbi:MAG: SRPBCC family protein [Actinobacteria bacterium]|nr:SRPBCC family protein [Actinomycetota bacterium]